MSEELPAVARLYYSGSGHRRYKRASTRSGPGEPLCFVSVASYALRRRDAEIAMLRLAIQKTLDENGHLADGDNCTLIRLKRALETSNGKVRGASPLAGEASSREAATSTVVLERKEAE